MLLNELPNKIITALVNAFVCDEKIEIVVEDAEQVSDKLECNQCEKQ